MGNHVDLPRAEVRAIPGGEIVVGLVEADAPRRPPPPAEPLPGDTDRARAARPMVVPARRVVRVVVRV